MSLLAQLNSTLAVQLANLAKSDDPEFNKTIILTEMLSHAARKRHRNLPS